MGHGRGTKEFNFGDDPFTVRIQESEVRNPDSLDRLCWRSAEVCALLALLVLYALTSVNVHRFLTASFIAAVGFPYNKLLSRTLYLQVLDYDRFTRDDPIGEVCLPLCDISLAREQTFWRTLQPCKGHTVRAVIDLHRLKLSSLQ